MPLLEIKLKPKLIYKLKLTPQIKLSLNLLQLPLIQLKEYIQQEIEKNPLLESIEHYPASSRQEDKNLEKLSKEKTQYQQDLITQTPALREHLLGQLQLSAKSKKDFEIGEFIIDSIDENGYFIPNQDCGAGFTNFIEDIAKVFKVNFLKVEEVFHLIQSFDPVGVGAINLRECLLLQLKAKGKEDSLASKIVDKYLSFLEKRRYEYIAKSLKVSVEKVKETIKEIAELEPKPGRSITKEKTRYILPDAVLRKTSKGYEAVINDQEPPAITINEKYKKMIRQKDISEDTKVYLKEKLESAQLLINAILRRKETIQKIIKSIVYIQKDFFDKKADLKPMTLSQIANMVGRHKSTISRAVSNKYIQTPQGIFELRYFINSGIKQKNILSKTEELVSSKTIKTKIKDLIINENKEKPLTDQNITEFLKNKEELLISRRTVAKYRKQLKILSSKLR